MAGEYDHFDAATTDAGQIRMWAAQEPNANVGISPDEIFASWKRMMKAHRKRRAQTFRPPGGIPRGLVHGRIAATTFSGRP